MVGHKSVLLILRRIFAPRIVIPIRQRIIERQVRNETGFFDTRQIGEPPLELTKKEPIHLRSWIPLAQQGNSEGQNVLRGKSGMDTQDIEKCSCQQNRSREEHKRQSDLTCNEDATE